MKTKKKGDKEINLYQFFFRFSFFCFLEIKIFKTSKDLCVYNDKGFFLFYEISKKRNKGIIDILYFFIIINDCPLIVVDSFN